ncbi:MAG TPA: LacI family DNA-binding transcriptional regulator [Anaerolineales bacterium]|jgi:LacI family transcriptional regulator|nr:LacI family DNA-binding transcriptional regulator [Anaerolineales bacterium]
MADLTLEDIAKKAGISRSTVSRVVNNDPNVREDVRRRVLDVIEKTGYHPHAAARALASQHSWTLGLVLPQSVSFFFTDPYYPHLTKGIAQGCNQYNYTLALFLVDAKEDEEKIFPRVSRKGLLDGVIVQAGHHGDQQIIGDLIDANMPLVVAGRPFRSDNVSYIDIDNVNASYNAVSHLIRLGHKRIGTIAGPADSTVGTDRKDGYLKALTSRGHTIDESLIVEGDFTEAGGYYAMQKLLGAKPDAVFAASDIMAIGGMRATREAGLKIPEDIAFVGFDDLPIATLSDVQLTTIRQPVIQFGVKAVEILLDQIENGIHPPRRVIMDTELIIRESCGASIRK